MSNVEEFKNGNDLLCQANISPELLEAAGEMLAFISKLPAEMRRDNEVEFRVQGVGVEVEEKFIDISPCSICVHVKPARRC